QLTQSIGLQYHNSIREFQRSAGPCVLMNVAIHVGAGQSKNDRPIRMCLAESNDRCMTAARMERDKDVDFLVIICFQNRNTMIECFQKSGPAFGGDAVAAG